MGARDSSTRLVPFAPTHPRRTSDTEGNDLDPCGGKWPQGLPHFPQGPSLKCPTSSPVTMMRLKLPAHGAAEDTTQTLSKPEPGYETAFGYSRTLNTNYQLLNNMSHPRCHVLTKDVWSTPDSFILLVLTLKRAAIVTWGNISPQTTNKLLIISFVENKNSNSIIPLTVLLVSVFLFREGG